MRAVVQRRLKLSTRGSDASRVRFPPYRLAAIALVVLVVSTAAGCSSSQHRARKGETVVRVSESDFRISTRTAVVPAGDVQLAVHNKGPVAHEMIVVRAQSSGLPLRTDGMTLNEEALEPAIVGTLEAGEPGRVRQMHVRLKPGRYVLFCNMAGHYRGGMHTGLVAK
jgi:uncharacterized cupredoxin-like copper-binding protein